MKGVALAMVAATAMLGCEDLGAPGSTGGRGPGGATSGAPERRIVGVARAGRAARTWEATETPPPLAPAPAPTPQVIITQTPEAQPARPPRRDYEEELRTLAGDPVTCLTAGLENDRVTIALSAIVTESGVISRVSATSSDDASAATCIARRLERARFTAPIPDAPRTVTTSLELRYRRAP